MEMVVQRIMEYTNRLLRVHSMSSHFDEMNNQYVPILKSMIPDWSEQAMVFIHRVNRLLINKYGGKFLLIMLKK